MNDFVKEVVPALNAARKLCEGFDGWICTNIHYNYCSGIIEVSVHLYSGSFVALFGSYGVPITDNGDDIYPVRISKTIDGITFNAMMNLPEAKELFGYERVKKEGEQ